jgi:hypothetical protein
VSKEYILSERFIHDELRRRCEAALPTLYNHWRKDRRIYPYLLMWPNDTVRTRSGDSFNGVVFTELSMDATERKEQVKRAAGECNAYGLMLTEQLEDAVRVIFETEHGTRTWRLPINDHGDVQVLGAPVVKDNAESIGVLWTAN